MKNEFTFKVINFGCPVNQYEAHALESAMQEEGFTKVNDSADIYIINSCVVTASAAAEARRALRNAKRENPFALGVLAGCYSQVYYRDIKDQLPEADMIIGTTGRSELPRVIHQKMVEDKSIERVLVKEHNGREKFEEIPLRFKYGRTRPVVKIQEGCDEGCTYCAISRARGKPRSLAPQKVIEQVKNFVDSRYREVILAGNHLGIYGKDLHGWDLVKLIKELDLIPGDFRIRLNYLEPMDVKDSFLEAVAGSDKICPHLYLPLQSGSNRILRKMGRKYTAGEFCRLVTRARELMPEVSIFTDVIAGFPGETEEDHWETVSLIDEMKLSRLHVFSYSPRPGTPAEKFPDNVRPDIKKKRVQELRDKDLELAGIFHTQMLGKEMEAIIERVVNFDGNMLGEGLSANNIRVRAPLENKCSPGEVIKVRAAKAYNWGIEGNV